ncbi:helix-turn-helix transcriptional regulator [Microbacterium foliorum]|uniref:Helix-turn-helix transcriptional regulator n=1 Tax=Microbacterium foliorum TaxID=104336 RepID=A0A4Y5YRT3_9MICO|nr:helix-turn-helix transcriptional regulator [Microbacterium foliorum]QDE35601.1 helix-turn-helix transcriptional regulator [Microbacterium foliorum]
MPDNYARVAHAMVDVLRDRTRELGLTQVQLAERAGITQDRVSRVYGHGVTLSFEVAIALCASLDLSLEAAYQAARRRASTEDSGRRPK